MPTWLLKPTLLEVESAITTVATVGFSLRLPPWRSNPALPGRGDGLTYRCHTESGGWLEFITGVYPPYLYREAGSVAIIFPPHPGWGEARPLISNRLRAPQ